jgi:hypothetical protein|tara:strand:+ start:17096 stop:17452 length:357 start_codon:yes stop_codon:yes gene_type:complete
MKIRYDENYLEIGDFRLIRVDDWNVELQELNEKGWEFVGYYGDLANAVRVTFVHTMNKIRRTLKAEDPNHPYLEMYGDVEEVGGKVKASCSNKALGMEHLPIAKLRKLKEQGISPTGE